MSKFSILVATILSEKKSKFLNQKADFNFNLMDKKNTQKT